jgi:hypothetical protein
MSNGKGLLCLGLLAGLGLLSVRDSQEQIELGYRIGKVERQVREVRRNTAAEQAKLMQLTAPQNVLAKAIELKLCVAPLSPLEAYLPPGPDGRRLPIPPARSGGDRGGANKNMTGGRGGH